MPADLRVATTGFSNLVNARGAEDIPNGITGNTGIRMSHPEIGISGIFCDRPLSAPNNMHPSHPAS